MPQLLENSEAGKQTPIYGMLSTDKKVFAPNVLKSVGTGCVEWLTTDSSYMYAVGELGHLGGQGRLPGGSDTGVEI